MCCPKLLVSLFATMLLIDGMPHATAQDYPTRTVTIIVPFTPAGATDILGRMAAAALEAQLGKSFVVENRPGAGQQIGVNAVARAAPDGYTLLVATSSAMAINPTLYKKISYERMTARDRATAEICDAVQLQSEPPRRPQRIFPCSAAPR